MEVCYRYDGTFAGFLTCVFESYAHHEPPMAFRLWNDDPTLFDERVVITHEGHAKRVYAALKKRVSLRFQDLISKGFLTCLPDRELDLYTLMERGLREGNRVTSDLSDPVMARLTLALQKLWTEQDHLKGFVRFVEVDGALVGEIEPKNRVLPLLGPHFAGRFNGDTVILHDRAHHEALICQRFRWTITPVEDFSLGPAGAGEEELKNLWRRYFKTLSIEGRFNPKCQSTHLPKRYRPMMCEFEEEKIMDGQKGFALKGSEGRKV